MDLVLRRPFNEHVGALMLATFGVMSDSQSGAQSSAHNKFSTVLSTLDLNSETSSAEQHLAFRTQNNSMETSPCLVCFALSLIMMSLPSVFTHSDDDASTSEILCRYWYNFD